MLLHYFATLFYMICRLLFYHAPMLVCFAAVHCRHAICLLFAISFIRFWCLFAWCDIIMTLFMLYDIFLMLFDFTFWRLMLILFLMLPLYSILSAYIAVWNYYALHIRCFSSRERCLMFALIPFACAMPRARCWCHWYERFAYPHAPRLAHCHVPALCHIFRLFIDYSPITSFCYYFEFAMPLSAMFRLFAIAVLHYAYFADFVYASADAMPSVWLLLILIADARHAADALMLFCSILSLPCYVYATPCSCFCLLMRSLIFVIYYRHCLPRHICLPYYRHVTPAIKMPLCTFAILLLLLFSFEILLSFAYYSIFMRAMPLPLMLLSVAALTLRYYFIILCPLRYILMSLMPFDIAPDFACCRPFSMTPGAICSLFAILRLLIIADADIFAAYICHYSIFAVYVLFFSFARSRLLLALILLSYFLIFAARPRRLRRLCHAAFFMLCFIDIVISAADAAFFHRQLLAELFHYACWFADILRAIPLNYFLIFFRRRLMLSAYVAVCCFRLFISLFIVLLIRFFYCFAFDIHALSRRVTLIIDMRVYSATLICFTALLAAYYAPYTRMPCHICHVVVYMFMLDIYVMLFALLCPLARFRLFWLCECQARRCRASPWAYAFCRCPDMFHARRHAWSTFAPMFITPSFHLWLRCYWLSDVVVGAPLADTSMPGYFVAVILMALLSPIYYCHAMLMLFYICDVCDFDICAAPTFEVCPRVIVLLTLILLTHYAMRPLLRRSILLFYYLCLRAIYFDAFMPSLRLAHVTTSCHAQPICHIVASIIRHYYISRFAYVIADADSFFMPSHAHILPYSRFTIIPCYWYIIYPATVFDCLLFCSPTFSRFVCFDDDIILLYPLLIARCRSATLCRWCFHTSRHFFAMPRHILCACFLPLCALLLLLIAAAFDDFVLLSPPVLRLFTAHLLCAARHYALF